MMEPSSRTPEGEPNFCPVCGHLVQIEPSRPPGDAPCPYCGHLLWFVEATTYESLDFVPPDAVIRRMEVTDKLAAIATLVNRLHATGNLRQDTVEAVIASMVRREELGSTGVGGGLAIPHTKHPSVPHVIGAIGYSPSGIDFNSLDHRPVHTIVMLLSPPDKPGDHLRLRADFEAWPSPVTRSAHKINTCRLADRLSRHLTRRPIGNADSRTYVSRDRRRVGVGAATARMLVAAGANVVLADVNPQPGESLAAELGAAARFRAPT